MSAPLLTFLRAPRAVRDPLAVGLVAVIACFSIVLLLVPAVPALRVAAMKRFHLSGWPFAAWTLFQPLPSMYNFENRWTVTFTGPESTDDDCPSSMEGYINHHIFHRLSIPAGRARFVRCAPAQVRFVSTYRGTRAETVYNLSRPPTGAALRISPAAP